MKINLTARIFISLLLGILAGQVYRYYHPMASDCEAFATNIQVLSDVRREFATFDESDEESVFRHHPRSNVRTHRAEQAG